MQSEGIKSQNLGLQAPWEYAAPLTLRRCSAISNPSTEFPKTLKACFMTSFYFLQGDGTFPEGKNRGLNSMAPEHSALVKPPNPFFSPPPALCCGPDTISHLSPLHTLTSGLGHPIRCFQLTEQLGSRLLKQAQTSREVQSAEYLALLLRI